MTKVAIVTGSNCGIGLAIVRALCKQFDGDVYLTSRNVERGQAAVKKLEGEGLKPKYHQLDISDAASLQALYDFVMATYQGVDVLVNNAGVFADAESTINVNYVATQRATEQFFPAVKRNGRVVIVSSELGTLGVALCRDDVTRDLLSLDLAKIGGRMREYVRAAREGTLKESGLPDRGTMGPYCMSKAGATLLAMAYAKAAAADGNGVLVNACCPGYVATDLGSDDRVTGKMAANSKGKSTDLGAETPVYLALLPADSKIQGRFVVNKVDKTEIFLNGQHSKAPKK